MKKRMKKLLFTALIATSATVMAQVDNTNILVEQAVNHIYQQRYKQAHAILKTAYEQSPRHPGVHFNLGRLFELTGNFEEALKEYRLAASLDQSMVAARRGMARCSVELKKASLNNPINTPQTAPVVTQRQNPTPPPSPAPNQYVLPASPTPKARHQKQNQQNYSSAPVVSQNAYSHNNDVVKTSKVYSSTSNLNLPPLPANVTAQASNQSGESKARALLDKGETDNAIKSLNSILEKNPDSPEAHYLMGKALSIKGDLFGSIKHLEESIRVNEKYYEAYYLLGRNYAKVNLLEDSIKNYLIYYGVKPQASVATEIARVYEAMGRQAQANDFYRKANAMNPGNSNIQMRVNESAVGLANDLYLRGNHAFSINQFMEAASLLNQALETNSLPDSARRDAIRKLEIAKFRIREREKLLAPVRQGFHTTRKKFAPTSLKYYQLLDMNYKNNFTNAISVEWTAYIAKRFTRYGRDFALMIKELDRDEMDHMNKTDNDYRLNRHYNNQPVFLLMASKGTFPDFIREKTMITFNGKAEWQFYEIVNEMGSTLSLPTLDYVSAFPVGTRRR